MELGKAVKALTIAAAMAGMLAVSVPAMAITQAQLNQLNNEDTQFQQRALQAERESQKGEFHYVPGQQTETWLGHKPGTTKSNSKHETLREQMLKQQARARVRQKRIQAQAAQARSLFGKAASKMTPAQVQKALSYDGNGQYTQESAYIKSLHILPVVKR